MDDAKVNYIAAHTSTGGAISSAMTSLGTGTPLLIRMVRTGEYIPFLESLNSFSSRCCYGL